MKIENVNTLPTQKLYKAADLGLVTTLSLFFPIKVIDRSNPRKVLFVFDLTDELNDFVEKYWRSEIVVEPQIFTNQIKNIKTRIYSGE
jgi:hypothetical protein